jgi:hypothetical protein
MLEALPAAFLTRIKQILAVCAIVIQGRCDAMTCGRISQTDVTTTTVLVGETNSAESADTIDPDATTTLTVVAVK